MLKIMANDLAQVPIAFKLLLIQTCVSADDNRIIKWSIGVQMAQIRVPCKYGLVSCLNHGISDIRGSSSITVC